MRRLIIGMLALGLVAGCSTTSVVTDYADDVDFSQFRTFQYKDSGTTMADTNQLAHRRIVNAIRREMTASGLTEVESNPDVYVSYYGRVDEQVVEMTTFTGYNTQGIRWHRHPDDPQWVTTTTTHRTGTLLIDIWEAAQKQLVWRGTVSDAVSKDPERNNARIDGGIAEAFESFPPGRGS